MLIQMMNILKKEHKNLNGKTIVLAILCSLYFSIVTTLSIVGNVEFVIIIGSILWLEFYVISIYFLNKIEINTERISQYSTDDREKIIKIFSACFVIIMLGQLLYWFAYFPGGFNLDAYGQWDQVHGLSHLNNWHPVFTTFIYWLLTRIIDNLAFCIFIQILAFVISVAYLMCELYRIGISKRYLVIVSVLIALNPAIGMNNICLIKDTWFTIIIVWIFISTIKIYASKGKWLCEKKHLIVMMTEFLALLLIRHNACFFVIPFIVLLCVLYRKVVFQLFITSICILISFLAIEGPLFSCLKIEPHSNMVGESVGIPMSIMANALVNDSQNVPKNVRNFLLEIADYNEWEKNYVVGEWDSCKWEFGGTELLKGESLEKIANLTLETMVSCPETSYLSIKENTRVVWQVIGYSEWDTWVYIEDNDYQIVPNESKICKKIVNAILECGDSLIGSTLIWNIGAVIILLMIGLSIAFKMGNYTLSIFVLPVLAYNFLTMLLLCGPSHRYFYFNSVLVLPIMLLLLKKKGALAKEKSR